MTMFMALEKWEQVVKPAMTAASNTSTTIPITPAAPTLTPTLTSLPGLEGFKSFYQGLVNEFHSRSPMIETAIHLTNGLLNAINGKI